jgi:hypothetical protein
MVTRQNHPHLALQSQADQLNQFMHPQVMSQMTMMKIVVYVV